MVIQETQLPKGNASEDLAVEVKGLVKKFGTNIAVNNVNLNVPKGSAFGYLGPNGAGKTTLIRSLLGLTQANSGQMKILGLEVPKHRSMALSRVGAIVDEPRFYGHLSGRQNLQMLAANRGGDTHSRIESSLERVGILHRANDKVKSYSMGMRQRLGIAACLIADPQLLMLDEPMNGLDPAGMLEMRNLIRGFVDEGRTVMLSSHLLDEIEKTCDAVAIVDKGTVIKQGPIEELLRGTDLTLQIKCSDPPQAQKHILEMNLKLLDGNIGIDQDSLILRFIGVIENELIAAINKTLVESGISVWGLTENKTSLEEWFLSVTSRLGGDDR